MSIGGPGPAPRHGAGPSSRRWVVLGALVLVSVLVLLFPAIPSPESGGPTPAWRQHVGEVLSVLSLIVVTLGAVLAWRAGMFDGTYAAQMRAVPRSQRRLARQLIRSRRPAPHELEGVATAMAGALVRQRNMALVVAGLGVSQASTALRATNTGWTMVLTVMVMVALVLVVITLSTARAARRWLATYAPTATLRGVR